VSSELLISADSHVVEDPQLWKKRLPAAFRERAPVFPELKVGGSFQAQPGGFDPKARVSEMGEDGVSGEVLYPSFGLDLFGLTDAALQEACFRVYNDWITEYCSAAPDRLFGIACIAAFDIGRAVEELERCKRAGLRGALVWQVPPPDLPFAGPHYERLWAAAQELEMPVNMHILTGHAYPYPRDFGPKVIQNTFKTGVNAKLLHAANAVSDLIATGVPERYPRLKFVLVENEISWLPFVLSQYDKYAKRRNIASDLKLAPSEYFERNFYATFFNDVPAGWVLGHWGTMNCMWSNDYPHPNSTWPKSREVIARDLGHLPAAARRRLLAENVRELYRLPAV
jgi:predicted TIM-barrel fold metal-dependent hydrolase